MYRCLCYCVHALILEGFIYVSYVVYQTKVNSNRISLSVQREKVRKVQMTVLHIQALHGVANGNFPLKSEELSCCDL